MPGIGFPSNLITEKTKINTPVSSSYHNSQIDTLEARDQYVLDFLSKFDALPLGTVIATSLNFGDNDLPNGFMWADGTVLNKEKYSKLWAIVQSTNSYKSMTDYENYIDEYFPGRSKTPNNITPYGYYVERSANEFYLPTLNNIFIMPVTSQGRVITGSYEPDTIKEHTHHVDAYPLNGTNLTGASANQIGVGLTDQITQYYQALGDNGYDVGQAAVTADLRKTPDLQSQTKPRSIAYRYMIKVDLTDFTAEANVHTDANSVNGYTQSIRSPLSWENITEKFFPIADPETGQLDPSWINTTYLSTQVLTDIRENLNEILSDNAIFKDESIEESVTATETPVVGSKTVPVSNIEGKININYLPLTTNEQINLLFA